MAYPAMHSLILLVLTCAAAAPLAAAAGCPKGQVWDVYKARCIQCPFGSVKVPDDDGADWATCQRARLVCGTAEVAKYGSCTMCSATQVASDDVKCANCPPGYTKSPPGMVGDAYCKRGSSCVPKQEVCNGKDDDCDGQVDEGITDLFCTPCNKKIPGCRAGKPNSCAGVCPTACCEDCADYPTAREQATCYRSCTDCRDRKACLEWADDVADNIAAWACEKVDNVCGIVILKDCHGAGCGPIENVLPEQCYYAAFDQCTSQAGYFVKSSGCPFYSTGGGTCSASSYQRQVNALISKTCSEVAVGIVDNLP